MSPSKIDRPDKYSHKRNSSSINHYQNDLHHWTESAQHAQRTPVILKLSQVELDSLLLSHQIKSHINHNLESDSLSLTPYGPPSSFSQSSAINTLIQSSLHHSDYDAIGVPLTNSNWRIRWDSLCVDQPSISQQQQQLSQSTQSTEIAQDAENWRKAGYFLSSEVNLHNTIETTKSICFASEWLELDSSVEGIRFDCELALKQELSYTTYLNASHLIIPMIRNRKCISDYGRAINSVLNGLASSVVLSIIVPIIDLEKSFIAWEDWHTLRQLCGYHPRLNITMELCHLSGGLDVTSLSARWASEPVGFVLIPATTFISNAKQFPVLGKISQAFLKSILKYKPSVILSQTSEGKHAAGGALAYVQYIRFLEKKVLSEPNDPIETFAAGYLDYLQAPLQPLADNLDSAVYEGFEKDPVKYTKYEEAIYQALCDRPLDATQVLAVCGAGRGPLVEAAIRAARRSGRTITLTAIEKNPNSYLTLQERLRTEWDPKIVQLWFGDMRDYQPIDPIDIIISELLGSFGDNELSPECLDGVIRWLAADGISIPASYCSFIAPLSSSKIYSRVMELGRFETPYVVMIHAAEIISQSFGPSHELGKVQEAWSFDHPRTDLVFSHETGVPITNFHNARASHLTFHIPQASICHGFAGYFRATLYGNVIIETHPESRMSREMLSWFPIFFPFKEPVYCPKDSELDIHLWRLTDQVGRKVWYEWSVEGFLCTPRTPKPVKDNRTESKNMITPPRSSLSSESSNSRKKKRIVENTDPSLLSTENHSTPSDRIDRTLPPPSTTTSTSLVNNSDHLNYHSLFNHNHQVISGDEEIVLSSQEPKESSLDSENESEFNLIEHLEYRIKIATSPLHNVLGREASVKW